MVIRLATISNFQKTHTHIHTYVYAHTHTHTQEDVEPYYDAYRYLAEMLETSDLKVSFLTCMSSQSNKQAGSLHGDICIFGGMQWLMARVLASLCSAHFWVCLYNPSGYHVGMWFLHGSAQSCKYQRQT